MPPQWPTYQIRHSGGNWTALNDLTGQLTGQYTVHAGALGVFASPAGMREYTLRVKWGDDNDKQRDLTIRAYPDNTTSVTVSAGLIEKVRKLRETIQKIKDKTGGALDDKWVVFPVTDNISLGIQDAGWVERAPGDARQHEVLYGFRINVAGLDPILRVQVPPKALTWYLPPPVPSGIFVQGELNGSVSIAGVLYRNAAYPNTNGGVTGEASIGGGLYGGVGADWALSVKGGITTSISGSLFVGAVPAERPASAKGIGLEGTVRWDGVSFKAILTTLGHETGEKTYNVIGPQTICNGHNVWIPFGADGAK